MNTYRKTATIVGALFIVGTVAGILSVVLTSSTLSAPNYLARIAANGNRITLGALSILVMGFALAMVPVLMFPIFRKQNETLALGYVVFRGALETFTSIFIAICWLLLLPLSQEFVKAGAPNASHFQTSGALLVAAAELPMLVFIFSLGALIFYSLLYQSKLIPRWLSVWGLVAIALHLTTGLLIVFGLQNPESGVNTAMNFPIFSQEMVMAVWLIVKGFNPSAISSLFAPAKPTL